MTDHKGRFSIFVAFNDFTVERSWISDISFNSDKVSIGEPYILCWKYLIEMFENLATHKLIISINNYKYLVWLTIFLCSFVDIWHCHLPLLIDNDFEFLLWYFVLVCPFFNLLAGSIIGCIINEDNMIVTVILLDNRLHIFNMPIIIDILEAGDHNTNWKLFIFWYLIFLFIILFFFLSQLWVFSFLLQC